KGKAAVMTWAVDGRPGDRLIVNVDLAENPAQYSAEATRDSLLGYYSDPIGAIGYGDTVSALGRLIAMGVHAINDDTADEGMEEPQFTDQAWPTLRRYHQAVGEQPGDFVRWLRNGLTSSCFDEHGDLDLDKALAEAFAGVWHWGADASGPEKVLCVLLLR